MKIALVHQIHVNLTFVTADQRQNAQEEPIHVQPDNANAVNMMNAHLTKLVFLENARVNDFQSLTSHYHYLYFKISLIIE